MSVMPLALLAFFAFGVLLVLPGALQPVFADAFALDLAQSGGIASALLIGVGAGVVASGPLVDRAARRPLFVGASLACVAALIAAACAASYGALLAAFAALGVAGGCYETLLNAAVPEAFPERAAARLSLAHAAATLGAALGAPLLARAALASGWPATLAALAVLFAGLAALGLVARFPEPPGSAARVVAKAALPLRVLAPLALAACAYVGVETAFSALLPALARVLGAGEQAGWLGFARGSLAISGFWVGLFAARVLFARMSLPARPRELVLGGAAAALLLALGAPLAAQALELWSAAIGFALGAVFPVLVVLAGDAAPPRRATALALVVAAGSIGGGAIPWLAGEAGGALGAGAALAVLAAGSAAIACGAALARRARP
ncbi:MAG TPA: MFS transporter [Myxococcota bacterium]|jgi:fucose permease